MLARNSLLESEKYSLQKQRNTISIPSEFFIPDCLKINPLHRYRAPPHYNSSVKWIVVDSILARCPPCPGCWPITDFDSCGEILDSQIRKSCFPPQQILFISGANLSALDHGQFANAGKNLTVDRQIVGARLQQLWLGFKSGFNLGSYPDLFLLNISLVQMTAVQKTG